MSRRTDICIFFGKEDKIAGHGLCYTCYRHLERRVKANRVGVAALLPEEKRLLRLYATTIANLVELGVAREDVLAIKKVYLDPCVSSATEYLNIAGEGAQ
jgi:hypothetical protein